MRFETIKGKDKIPIDKPYWNEDTLEEFKVVKIRHERKRKAGTPPFISDTVEWLEGTSMQEDGIILPMIYHTRAAPIIPVVHKIGKYNNPIFPNCLYPVAIFNITNALLDAIDNKPFWKTMPATTIPDAAGNFELLGYNGSPFNVFHFVVINNRYVPNPLPAGGTDDGNWVVGKPVSGQWIMDELQKLDDKAKDPLSYSKLILHQNEVLANVEV